MAEFLSNAPSSQLLILMLCPIGAVILLAGFLFFSFTRRRRKSAMKLGIQPKTKGREDILTEQQTSSDEPVAGGTPLPESSAARPDEELPPIEEDLNLNILGTGGMVAPETADMPSPIDAEPVDLAARLGGQPDRPAAKPQPTTVAASSAPTEVTSVSVFPAEENTAELLRLLRHPQTGQLMVEVAGKRYNKLTDITDREVGQYILELAANFLAFTNGVVATEAGVKSVYLPKVKQTPQPLLKSAPVTTLPDPDDVPSPRPEPGKQKPPEEPLVPPPPPEAEAAFLASLQDLQTTPQPPPPTTQSRGFFGLSRPSKESTPAIPQFNLAGEINQIVQTRLMASPLAETTKIEILSDPSGGIRIKVNGQIYAGPDDVLDPDIKTLIKDSIKQWERS